jgi:glycosyltransferase involved in cell wall biosynthesis
MKILHVIESLGQGGAEQALVNLLPALARRGHQCEVAALWGPYPLAEPLERAGIPVHRMDLCHRWALWQGLPRLEALYRRGRYDVVHAHLFFSGVYTALTRRAARPACLVVTFHNLGYDSYPARTAWHKVRKRIDGWLMRHAVDGRTAVSETTARHYERHLHLAGVTVIPVAVDLEAFEPARANGAANRLAAYGVRADEFAMVVPGRFVPEKGHRFLLQALQLLRQQDLRPKVLCFGDGPLASELADERAKRGLDGQVTLHRSLPNAELLGLVRAAHAVVMPSTNEGLPISALEAMALERPLVASRIGGLQVLIEDGVSGLLVPPADPRALAEGIARLMADPGLRQRLGHGARRRVETGFSTGAAAVSWEKYYNEVRSGEFGEPRTRLKYLVVEIPRRLVRASLCGLYDVNAWHIASSANKPYVLDVIAYLEGRRPLRVVEVGCGFCDILSHVPAPVRLGYDADAHVIRAAQMYTQLTRPRVALQRLDLMREGVPDVAADAWILVNWLHDFEPEPVTRRLRQVFARLPSGGVMVFDTVPSPPYRYAHDARAITDGLPCRLEPISREPDGGRTVWAAERTPA